MGGIVFRCRDTRPGVSMKQHRTRKQLRKSAPYLTWLRGKPCFLCGRPGEPHHVKLGDNSGTAMKPPDYDCLPVCRDCHEAIEGGPVSYLSGVWPVLDGEDAKTVLRMHLYKFIKTYLVEYIIESE